MEGLYIVYNWLSFERLDQFWWNFGGKLESLQRLQNEYLDIEFLFCLHFICKQTNEQYVNFRTAAPIGFKFDM